MLAVDIEDLGDGVVIAIPDMEGVDIQAGRDFCFRGSGISIKDGDRVPGGGPDNCLYAVVGVA